MSRGPFIAARITNIALGLWLVLSALAWPHSEPQRTNTWIVGALCIVFELVAFFRPMARYLSTVISVWLFISAWALPRVTVGTQWNNAFFAIAIFLVSLAPMRTIAGDAQR